MKQATAPMTLFIPPYCPAMVGSGSRTVFTLKKDKYSRIGKNGRCGFGTEIAILHQDDLKKRMNIIMATWQNGCFEKMFDHLVHPTPNHHSSNKDVFPKTCLKIILAAKWLARNSSMSPTSRDKLCLPFCISIYSSSMLV